MDDKYSIVTFTVEVNLNEIDIDNTKLGNKAYLELIRNKIKEQAKKQLLEQAPVPVIKERDPSNEELEEYHFISTNKNNSSY